MATGGCIYLHTMQTPTTTTMTTTNATNHGLAQYLANQGSKVTFTAVRYTKVGTRGKGRDTVIDTIITGFSYEKLLVKDLATVQEITAEQLHASCKAANVRDKDGAVPGVVACRKALNDHASSIVRSLAGTNVSTTDGVREPLEVNGEPVHGCWVNNGTVDPAKTGETYMYGLRVGRKVITRDPNRPAATQSRSDVAAKNHLKREFLRVGRWCMIKLVARGGDWTLKLGGKAVAMATENGITELDGVTVREAYDAAQAA